MHMIAISVIFKRYVNAVIREFQQRRRRQQRGRHLKMQLRVSAFIS